MIKLLLDGYEGWEFANFEAQFEVISLADLNNAEIDIFFCYLNNLCGFLKFSLHQLTFLAVLS